MNYHLISVGKLHFFVMWVCERKTVKATLESSQTFTVDMTEFDAG